jgi:PDDEXK-like domain of unknown function (DUF3799)
MSACPDCRPCAECESPATVCPPGSCVKGCHHQQLCDDCAGMGVECPECAAAYDVADPETVALILDLDEAEYHRHPALSQSGAKTLLISPALYAWERANPTPRKVFEEGSAAHTLVLGVGPEPVVIMREIRDKKGGLLEVIEATDLRSQSAQEHQDAIRKAGGIPVLRTTMDHVTAMADRLSSHTLAMRLLSEGQAEVSIFATDPATGVELRGRLDWLGATVATDYKTTQSKHPGAFGKAAFDYGYHQQAAWYLDLLEAVGHPRQAFAFIVQSKTPPYDVFVTELHPDAIALGRARNRQAIERFRDCRDSGLWPAAVRDDTYLITNLPRWAYMETELEEFML